MPTGLPAIGRDQELQFEKVDRRYVTRGVRDILLTPGLLDTEKPEVVILQTLERYWTM